MNNTDVIDDDDDDDADAENDDDLIYSIYYIYNYAYDTLQRQQFLATACRSPDLWITRLWIAPDKRIVNALGSVQRTDEWIEQCFAASAC